ncbi:hypothetical protein Q9295_16280 [Xinfangfangia sp. CPCC 101601]|uniref:Uncharacterized protein n=1 Tax=Pseudogemmobacter lacusdianii TaxID=3069608 RepID=A0ABU0W1U2_9RHOB|nr:hypothetical protein [Xinfangfangia sp. CPCC 101601]MDQ2067934.1 hypothetical protein [Xinfangfangia sp. CPCC 101601]
MSNIPQTFFADPVTERLFQSVVALAAEVNVLRDRVARLEAGAEAAPQANAAADADAFVQHVFGGLVQA